MAVERSNGKLFFVRNRIKGDEQPSTVAATPMRPMVPESKVQFAENENFSTGRPSGNADGTVVEEPKSAGAMPNVTGAAEGAAAPAAGAAGTVAEPQPSMAVANGGAVAEPNTAMAAEGAAAPAAMTEPTKDGGGQNVVRLPKYDNGGVDTSKLAAMERATPSEKQNENQTLREMNEIDPSLVDLHKMSPEEARLAMNTMKSENLEQAMENNKWAMETPEQKAKREKKERLDRNLAGALSMIGALGNYASAAYSTDGRSVPVGDFSAAEGKAEDERYKQRDAALAKLREAGRRKSEIIDQGYKNVRVREKEKRDEEQWQKQYEETVRAKKAAEALQAGNQALKAQQLQDAKDRAETTAAETKRHNLATEAIGRTRNEVARISANNKSNGSGRGSNSKKVFKIDGKTYDVPTNVWNSVGIAQLSTFLPWEYRNRLKPNRFGKTEDVETLIGEYTKDTTSHNANPTAWEDFTNWMNALASAGDPEGDLVGIVGFGDDDDLEEIAGF